MGVSDERGQFSSKLRSHRLFRTQAELQTAVPLDKPTGQTPSKVAEHSIWLSEGVDTLKSDALLPRAAPSCCGVTPLGFVLGCFCVTPTAPVGATQKQPNTNPMGRRGGRVAGCVAAAASPGVCSQPDPLAAHADSELSCTTSGLGPFTQDVFKRQPTNDVNFKASLIILPIPKLAEKRTVPHKRCVQCSLRGKVSHGNFMLNQAVLSQTFMANSANIICCQLQKYYFRCNSENAL